MPFERTDVQNFNCVSADQGCAAQYDPASSHVSSVAYGGESSVSPIPSGVPSGFVQTAPLLAWASLLLNPPKPPMLQSRQAKVLGRTAFRNRKPSNRPRAYRWLGSSLKMERQTSQAKPGVNRKLASCSVLFFRDAKKGFV